MDKLEKIRKKIIRKIWLRHRTEKIRPDSESEENFTSESRKIFLTLVKMNIIIFILLPRNHRVNIFCQWAQLDNFDTFFRVEPCRDPPILFYLKKIVLYECVGSQIDKRKNDFITQLGNELKNKVPLLSDRQTLIQPIRTAHEAFKHGPLVWTIQYGGWMKREQII